MTAKKLLIGMFAAIGLAFAVRFVRRGRGRQVEAAGWGTPTALDELLPEAPFTGSVSVRIKASPAEIFRAFADVTPHDMPIATFLGNVRYLPGRLMGKMPLEQKQSADEPFAASIEQFWAELKSEPESELVLGGAGKYHQVLNQEPVALHSRQDFEAFDKPEFQKQAISVRINGGDAQNGYVLTLEHRTQPLSDASAQKFKRYWRVIRPTGNFVTRQLLLAVKTRAERYAEEHPAAAEPVWFDPVSA